MDFFSLSCLVFRLLLAVSSAACQSASVPLAKTSKGTYLGRRLAEFDQELFLGVKFASAPRFENPKLVAESWEGQRSAEWFGPACYSSTPLEVLAPFNLTMAEDCLNLNIVRPAGYDLNTRLPVVVWFHGGGFATGFGAGANTSYIVKASVENDMPVIAVTFNYRLGMLGFPGGYQALAARITNLGLKDQRAALEWIQENIAAFGGDPGRVTLWGQSAGAMAISHQVLAYDGQNADKLFRGAILESGSAHATNFMFPTHPMCVLAYESAVNVTNCTDAENTLDCLRKAPADVIFRDTQAGPFTFWPSIDGDFLREPPTWQLQKGHFSKKISIIAGANNDEGLISALYFGPTVETVEELKTLLKSLFPAARPSTIEAVLDAYPDGAQAPPYSLPMAGDTFCEAMRAADLPCGAQFRRVAAILGDYAQIGGRRQMTRQWAMHGAAAYSFRFDTNPTSIPINLNVNPPGFATHSAELAYFFAAPPDYGLLGGSPPVANITSHLDLSRGIVDKLISFITTGDPNTFKVPAFPDWPLYTVDEPTNMVFNATEADNRLNVHVEPDTWREEGMALWAKYGIELQFESNWRP